jgi:hypothetical protein
MCCMHMSSPEAQGAEGLEIGQGGGEGGAAMGSNAVGAVQSKGEIRIIRQEEGDLLDSSRLFPWVSKGR